MKQRLLGFFLIFSLSFMIVLPGFCQQNSFQNLPEQIFGPAPAESNQPKPAPSKLPVPPSTDIIKPPKSMAKNAPEFMDLNIRMFLTDLSKEKIKEFYKANLPRYGWQEFNIIDSVSQIIDLPSKAKGLQGNSIMFTKKPYTLTILFIGCSGSTCLKPVSGERMKYSLNISKMPTSAEMQSIMQPQKPQKVDFMPIHSSLKEMAKHVIGDKLFLTYASASGPASLAAYYKKEMPKYGWTIKKEKSPPSAESMPQSPEVEVYSIEFSKEKGQECQMRFLRASGNNALGPGIKAGQTLVSVTYTDNK